MAGVLVVQDRVQHRDDIAVDRVLGVVTEYADKIARHPQFEPLPVRVVRDLADLLQDLLRRLWWLLPMLHHAGLRTICVPHRSNRM